MNIENKREPKNQKHNSGKKEEEEKGKYKKKINK